MTAALTAHDVDELRAHVHRLGVTARAMRAEGADWSVVEQAQADLEAALFRLAEMVGADQ